MFGTNAQLTSSSDHGLLTKLFDVLDRNEPVDPLDSLISAMTPGPKTKAKISASAIGLDANVFLRLGGHARVADIVDYLNTEHPAPIILPGQIVQEFWNNQLAAVATVATSAKSKFEQFKTEAEKLDPNAGGISTRINSILEEYKLEYGHLYEESTVRSTLSLLEVLQSKAITSFAPRMRFQQMAAQRKLTKTPPGFRDNGDGDFYVWIDFLYGLQKAQRDGLTFTNVILITNDQKPDWSRAGVPHPILSAEVKSLLGVTFELWTLDEFHRAL